jgi:hypothetical protein
MPTIVEFFVRQVDQSFFVCGEPEGSTRDTDLY